MLCPPGEQHATVALGLTCKPCLCGRATVAAKIWPRLVNVDATVNYLTKDKDFTQNGKCAQISVE